MFDKYSIISIGYVQNCNQYFIHLLKVIHLAVIFTLFWKLKGIYKFINF